MVKYTAWNGRFQDVEIVEVENERYKYESDDELII